eukprot:1382127-Prymnesium_polylepis.1
MRRGAAIKSHRDLRARSVTHRNPLPPDRRHACSIHDHAWCWRPQLAARGARDDRFGRVPPPGP